MGLVIAGIDEAGYGPLLGPLCVGMTFVRLERMDAGWTVDEPVDLWKTLRAGVCRKADDARGRIAVADSKKLKLANGLKSRHPLSFLERGVLAFAATGDEPVSTDQALLAALGCAVPGQRWYAGQPVEIPLAWTPGQIRIANNLARSAMTRAGVAAVELACCVVCEDEFNSTVKRAGSKAQATQEAIGQLLGRLHRSAVVQADDVIWVTCDRLGGRTRYGDMLRELIPGCAVSVILESERQSRYEVESAGRRLMMSFEVEGEEAHLPVALASMTAKLVRELLMMRFNRYWCGVEPSLKPTAGYRGDAWRWLEDAGGILSSEDRRAMIRIA